jgi:HemY protein
MGRLLLFLIQAGLIVAATVWIADNPGEVELNWLGYEVRAHVGFLILAVVLLMVLAGLLYHGWRRLLSAPRSARQAIEASRRRRGYQALTNGLVAVAAGDAAEARRWAKRSERLLDEPPLNLLLSAQAAQLADDEAAARQSFEAMLLRPETRFLGLRGLVQQSLKAGDGKTALGYVEEAYRLRPETPWVLETLFDLAEREGRLDEAARVLSEAKRRRALPAGEADRRRAVLLVEQAIAAERAGEAAQALDKAKVALRLAPELTAAARLAALAAQRLGRTHEAERILERAWTAAPHPELARLYLTLNPEATPAEKLKLLQRLTGGQPQHLESRLALAEAALGAGEWDEARRQLEPLERDAADARIALAAALLAEGEPRDPETARRWRERAMHLPAAPLWTCGLCGATSAEWQPRCPTCGGFDSLTWRPGPQGLVPLEAPRAEPRPLAVTVAPVLEEPSAPPPAAAPPPAPPPTAAAPAPAPAAPASALTPEDAVRRGL